MQKIIFTLFLIGFLQNASTQNVKEWKFDELETRIQAGKDTTYLINFWATWCRPCVAELPYFEALNKEMTTEKVKIILMSVDFPKEKESRLLPFLEKKQFRTEVGLWLEMNENEWINRVSKEWSGALPGTWVRNESKGVNQFYEKDFHSKEELKTIIPK